MVTHIDRIPDDLVHEFDIYNDLGIRRDLHQQYARLLDDAPGIFWTPLNGGHWIVTSYEAINAVVMDTDHFSNSQSSIPPVANPPRFIPLSLDPPENMPYRRILMPHFSPRSVAAMEERIDVHARQFVDAVKSRGACEFVKDVAAPFPVTVFMILMGLPLERFDELRALVENFFRSEGSDTIEDASAAIMNAMADFIALRRAEPQDDLMTKLLAAEIDGRPLSQDELINMCFLLLLGGLDTVTNHLTFSARFLATRPDIQDRLIADPSLIPAFIEEALRLFGVVNVPRIVKRDVTIGRAHFRQGDMVLVTLPMAGRDRTNNVDADMFDLDRKEKKHLTFSSGVHLCLGHFLARAELKKMCAVWLETIGRFEIAGDIPLSYRGGTVMALDELHLRWSL